MKIRASTLTPALAMLTVVALVATGIALGQSRRGDASAMLLDSGPSLTVAAATDAVAAAEVLPTAAPVQPVVHSSTTPAVGGQSQTASTDADDGVDSEEASPASDDERPTVSSGTGGSSARPTQSHHDEED